MNDATARELLDADAQGLSVPTADPYRRDYTPLKTLAARVEKVLALMKHRKSIGALISPYELERLLNGEEK